MARWVFGIDGGGTRSRIRAEALSGGVLHQGEGGAVNPRSVSPDAVTKNLEGLVGSLLGSGLDPRKCAAGFIGCAGVDRPEDEKSMSDRLADVFRREAARFAGRDDAARRIPDGAAHPGFAAGNDARAALAGAFGGTEGCLLAAGTGSIALGRDRTGRIERSGGWGHMLGDEGSAFWMAREGLRRGIRSAEGRGSPSALLSAALDHFGFSDPRGLLELAYEGFDKARIASFAPRVSDLAARGDPVASAVLEEAARELALLALSVYKRLFPELSSGRLAMAGGLLQKNGVLRSAVAARLAEAAPGLKLVEPLADASAGACLLARELVGQRSSGALRQDPEH